MKFTTFFISVFILPTISISQQLTATIVDIESGKPVPYVHIIQAQGGFATISNSDGEFHFDNLQENITLICSHISYQKDTVQLKDLKEKKYVWYIQASSLLLDEITIKSDSEGFIIAENIFSNLIEKKGPPIKYGKVFYKQFTSNNGIPIEIMESFNDISHSPLGIVEKKLTQGRYGLKKSEGKYPYISFSNYSAMVFGFKLTSVQKEGIIIPFNEHHFEDYEFSLVETYTRNGSKLGKINFKYLKESKQPYTEGYFICNLEDHQILFYEAISKHHLGLDNIRQEKNDSTFLFKNEKARYNWVVEFDENSNLSHIRSNCTLDFTDNNKNKVSLEVLSSLILYSPESKIKNVKSLKPPHLSERDMDEIRKAKYNQKFWNDKEIIKYTDKEKMFIRNFEEQQIFGNYFN